MVTLAFANGATVLKKTRVVGKLFAFGLVLRLDHGDLVKVVLWVLI